MDYKLLKNKVYLTLLAYYDGKEMPSFTELGKQIGITRQTASTKFKELSQLGLVELKDGIIIVKNDLGININNLKEYLNSSIQYFNPVQLKAILFGNSIEKTKMAKELGMSRSSLYLSDHSVVYAIQSEGKIKYIGTTAHFENRRADHIKKRPFLTPANFLILVDNVGSDKFNIELELIHLLKPEWNQVGTKV